MTSTEDTAFDPQVLEGLRERAGESLEATAVGRGLRIALVCARFNGAITLRLLEGALAALEALAYADAERPYDAVITLGAVIRGDTGHYELVAGECARGVQDVQLSTRVPVIFGVLTTNTIDQALERSQPDETNKGREAAESALAMISVLAQGSVATA
jgi:6,7-dimethyl-8-ribityllumazine synthase